MNRIRRQRRRYSLSGPRPGHWSDPQEQQWQNKRHGGRPTAASTRSSEQIAHNPALTGMEPGRVGSFSCRWLTDISRLPSDLVKDVTRGDPSGSATPSLQQLDSRASVTTASARCGRPLPRRSAAAKRTTTIRVEADQLASASDQIGQAPSRRSAYAPGGMGGVRPRERSLIRPCRPSSGKDRGAA